MAGLTGCRDYDLAHLREQNYDAVVANSVFHWLPDKTAALLTLCGRCSR